MQDRRRLAADDERRDDRPAGLGPAASAFTPVVDVERLELDPVLAKELPGRRAGRSGRLPEQRDAFHSGMIAAVKIAVVGTGAMGSVYAGLLGSAGNEVWAVDRWQEHVEAIREHGLRVEGASGDRVVRIHATTDAAEVGEAELVVLATKAMDVEAAAEAARAWSARTRSCSRSRTASAARTSPRRSSARAASPSASPAASAPRSSRPGTSHHHGFELVRLGERRAR